MTQAASSKSQQNSLPQSPPKADLPAKASKKPSTKGKELAMLEADGLAAAKPLPRLRRAVHTDTDTKLEKRDGQGQPAGPSHGAASQSVQQQKQRRSQRQPTTKAQGGQHALDPPAAGGVHVKPPSKQGIQTSLTAAKSQGKGYRTAGGGPEQKAVGSKQVAGALKKGKKAAGSRWEPAELELPFGSSAKGKKAVGSKSKLKNPLAHSGSKGKAPVGTKQRASRVKQSPAQEAKLIVDAKEEPAASPIQDDSNVHADQLSTGPSELPLGLGKGKRKRTATRPLYVDEDSQDEEEEQAGSKHRGVGCKLEEKQVYRYACRGCCDSLYADGGELCILMKSECSLRHQHEA